MLGPRTNELLALASEPLGPRVSGAVANGRTGQELTELLDARNGFYALESALHVFPAGQAFVGASLEDWNAPGGWRKAYGDMTASLFFFAEDVFGGQFAFKGDQVLTFEPETGEAKLLASSIEDWADQLLADYEFLTGQPLAHEWQVRNGALSPGERLVPKVPFVLGGDYDAGNVYAVDAAVGMELRGELAMQLRDLPDGAKVTYRVVD
jgi:hypothetical protein